MTPRQRLNALALQEAQVAGAGSFYFDQWAAFQVFARLHPEWKDVRASSKDERAALLDHYRRNLKPEEYRAVVQQIQKEGIVSARSLFPLISRSEQGKALAR